MDAVENLTLPFRLDHLVRLKLQNSQSQNRCMIAQAYKKAMARLHPDRTQHLAHVEERAEAEELYKQLNAQYERLK